MPLLIGEALLSTLVVDSLDLSPFRSSSSELFKLIGSPIGSIDRLENSQVETLPATQQLWDSLSKLLT